MPRFNVLNLVGPYSKRFANLPDRYIKRKMEQIYWKSPKAMNYLQITHQKKNFDFNTLFRPWTNEFQIFNAPGKNYPADCIEPIAQWSFFRGDRVEIIVGKDAGKQGIVKQIFEESNWVIVEGLNTSLKIVGKTDDFPGFAIFQEKPLRVTDEIRLVDPSDLKATEIEWRFAEDGEKVRVSTRTGRTIPIPPSHDETIDFKSPHLYREGTKDTLKKDVEEITFKPTLQTFEMNIMEKMNIQEDRVQKPTYWY